MKKHRNTLESSKQIEPEANDLQTETAYEYYAQCRAKNEELRKKRIASQMRGPISKKRLKALHVLKTRTKTSRKILVMNCRSVALLLFTSLRFVGAAEDIQIYDELTEEGDCEPGLEQEIEGKITPEEMTSASSVTEMFVVFSRGINGYRE